MNMPPMGQQGPPGMQQVMAQQPGTPQGQQMPQQPQMAQQAQEKLDNISKVKSLITQLRESLAVSSSAFSNPFTKYICIKWLLKVI